ncbi:MAG TPA: type II toxin-antitoxin system PemK/MazF family toxin [Acidimicrobiales bacterium]|nr:type II toxin-antitoxin system PemK/MazF family toxin [Acidimicrobiales bacterium]
MRVDPDLAGSAVAGALAAGAVIGTWHLQPELAILLGLVVLAACGVVWRRHHSFHEPLRGVARQALIEFVVLAAVAIALDLVLKDATGSQWLAGLVSAAAVGLLSAHRIAERWWRVPLERVPAPDPGEVWWAAVPFEEKRGSKDRPCLVLSRSRRHAAVLMFTSQDKSGRRGYVAVPNTMWHDERSSFLKTDRVIPVRREKFRRRESAKAPQSVLEVASRENPRAARFLPQ